MFVLRSNMLASVVATALGYAWRKREELHRDHTCSCGTQVACPSQPLPSDTMQLLIRDTLDVLMPILRKHQDDIRQQMVQEQRQMQRVLLYGPDGNTPVA